MTSSLAKSKQIIGAQFQTLFSTIFLLFDVPEYSNTFDYIKDTQPAFTLTTKKSLHIIFKASQYKVLHKCPVKMPSLLILISITLALSK